MKVAVMGAGFAGVSACYVLSKAGLAVTLFDVKGIGAGASGISPGLLHPYPGKFCTRKEEVVRAFEKTLGLIEVASQALGKSVVRSKGIIRLARGNAQAAHFRKCARRYPDCEEVEGGILLTEGRTINSRAYLEGLWQASAAQGANFAREWADSCSGFDRVVYASGPDIPLELKRVKGQVLVLKWPEEEPPLPHSLVEKKYLTMGEGVCYVGATYEETFDSAEPDKSRAMCELMPYVSELYPPLRNALVLECLAGVRAYLPGKEPAKVIPMGGGRFALAGLGSKGLLYHAHLAEKLLEI